MYCRYASLLCVCGIFFSVAAHADTYRCKSPSGHTVIASRPCEGGYTTTGVVQADSPNAVALQKAYSDLERQKRFLEMRERQNQPPYYSDNRVATVSRPPRDSVNDCLMNVAAKRLTPVSEAQSKISCYTGTGMRDECEMSVTATLGLTSNQENALRQQCKSQS